jgi:hypothetical protein
MAKGKVEQVDVVLKRSQPSVEIKRDAKGQLSYTIKVYADDIQTAVKQAVEFQRGLDKELDL